MNNIYAMFDNFSYLYSLPFSSIFNNFLYKNDNKNYANINEEFCFLIINKLSHSLKSNKKNYHTLDELDKRNDNEIVEFLKEKAPQIFKDGKLDLDAFKLAANLSNQEDDLTEKYGLNWKGKTNSIWKANQKSDKTLIPQRDKSMNFDQSNNIIIEGDNLDVLKTLQASYANKVDVIYIDPPYNTGNDFIYNDDFNQTSNEYKKENNLIDEEGQRTTTNQKTDGRFHTNWLNMMYPRLMLARKLLKEDGVIFISIDDNEQAHLKMICDEIFGEHNFAATIIFNKTSQGTTLGNGFKKTHEFILMYSKTNAFKLNLDTKKDLSKYIYKDEIGKYAITNKLNSINSYLKDNKNRGYTIYYNKDANIVKTKYEYNISTLIYEDKYDNDLINSGFVPIRPGIRKNKQTCWNWSEERFLKDWKNEIVFKKDSSGKLFPYHKNRENDKHNPFTIQEFDSRSGGARILNELFNEIVFNFAKPIDLIKWLLDRHSSKNTLVLDFFAGSGTTGQAVMDLNKEDGGNRQFILVQLPELIENNDQFKTISDITRERIKRSIEKYGYKEKGFKFFKLDESNLKSTNWTNQNSHQEFQQSLLDLSNKVKSNRSAEDVAYEIVLRAGLPFDKNLHQIEINNNLIFIDDSKSHIFILEATMNSKYYENIIDVVEEFAKDIAGGLNIYLNDQYFKNDEAKINFVEQVKSISEQIKVWVI